VTDLGRSTIIAELGLHTAADGPVVRGRVAIVPEVCAPGTTMVRTSVLATWADIVTGFVAGQTVNPRVPLTLDLEVQLQSGAHAGDRVVVDATAVKVGRTVIVCEARFVDELAGTPVAVAHASFIASPDPDHVFAGGFPGPTMLGGRLTVPLAERIGARTIAPGCVEVPHRPDGLNASGGIQGGLVAFAAEEAVLSLAADASVLEALNVRYLRQFSVGPAQAVAERHDGMAIVHLTDAGAGRLCAIASARLGRASRPDQQT